jgi:hypothetical protein
LSYASDGVPMLIGWFCWLWPRLQGVPSVVTVLKFPSASGVQLWLWLPRWICAIYTNGLGGDSAERKSLSR